MLAYNLLVCDSWLELTVLAVVAAILSMDPTKRVDDECQLHTPESTRISVHHDEQKQEKENNKLSNF